MEVMWTAIRAMREIQPRSGSGGANEGTWLHRVVGTTKSDCTANCLAHNQYLTDKRGPPVLPLHRAGGGQPKPEREGLQRVV